jgi:hypothetical protein
VTEDGLDLDLYDALVALELAGFPIEDVQVYLASPRWRGILRPSGGPFASGHPRGKRTERSQSQRPNTSAEGPPTLPLFEPVE